MLPGSSGCSTPPSRHDLRQVQHRGLLCHLAAPPAPEPRLRGGRVPGPRLPGDVSAAPLIDVADTEECTRSRPLGQLLVRADNPLLLLRRDALQHRGGARADRHGAAVEEHWRSCVLHRVHTPAGD
ncbi:hypothetical protein Taro_037860 [Colocasia esculenta]|uniref:Uncharacterized protein n=1 Tax=Colocasia esculenta TaxID=4460 RepID=A0A843WE43_COLES|nr:hypothetical protein [Colocasia esculenta]